MLARAVCRSINHDDHRHHHCDKSDGRIAPDLFKSVLAGLRAVYTVAKVYGHRVMCKLRLT